jgi:hypothetical protein
MKIQIFLKSLAIQNFMKIHFVVLEFLHAYRRTDRAILIDIYTQKDKAIVNRRSAGMSDLTILQNINLKNSVF